MKLIVGLGNVGKAYAATRHNVGFMVVRRLATRHRVRVARRSVEAHRVVARYGDWIAGKPVVRLMLPHTMMNRSGEALAALATWQVALEDLLLVCDDVNLPLGTLRLRAQGSAGGHHGLLSCFDALGTQAIARLRIGIGAHPLPQDLTNFVLSPFRQTEHPIIRQAIARAVEACERWTREGIQVVMNQMNRRAR